ncbi:MAG TPA: flagellar protein FlaG [Halanaerobiales bacterium]|nr:flagellar protein FlaG [Halanaerobiales bacterium]
MKTDYIEPVFRNQMLDIKDTKINKKMQTGQFKQEQVLPLQKNNILKEEVIKEEFRERVEETVNNMNDIVEDVIESLRFKLHEDTKRLMCQIINIETMEVIKELPPEEMLDLSARIQEMVGIILDEKV